MTTRDLTPEQVREMTRIAVLFFTGKESPQEREPQSSQERTPSSDHPFTAPETIRT
jgi:hypothetical protein